MAFSDLAVKLLTALGSRLSDAGSAIFRRYPARIGVAILLLILAVITGVIYVNRSDRYQEIVSTTVRSEMEDTPQRFKVLEAFVLSAVEGDLSQIVKQASMSKEFIDQLNLVDQVLNQKAEVTVADDVQVAVPDGVDKPWTAQSQNGILTDGQDPGYLFFPLKLLRTRLDNAQYAQVFSRSAEGKKLLSEAIAKDSVVADDIATSRRLSEVLTGFTKIPLLKTDGSNSQVALDDYPVQVYYITKNGLNRIVNNSGKSQSVVYRNLFRATTFFPSRPYFIEAFKRGEPQQLSHLTGTISDYFYVSQPYLDIGGFGVVITLARAVRYPDHSDAAICFDLRVRMDNPISFHLKQKLISFGATPEEHQCTIGFGGKVECPPKNSSGDDRLYQVRAKLERNIKASMLTGDLSTVVGNINILSDKESKVTEAGVLDFLSYPIRLLTGYGTSPISFSIPLDSPVAGNNNTLQADFLLCNLNLGRFLQLTSALGLSSIMFLASAFFIVLLSWQQEIQNRSGWQAAFDLFDGVMYAATTAYCRLDADDRVVDCNTSFAALLKRPPDQQTIKWLTGQTLESQIAPRSKGTYQDVQRRRRNRQNVGPYTLFLLCQDNSEVETRVTSGEIPTGTKGSLPETFGVFIPL